MAGHVGLDALDGELALLIMDFLDRPLSASAVMSASRFCFSASCCHKDAYFPFAAEWRAAAIGTLFEQDKKLVRAVSLVEGFAEAQEVGLVHEGAPLPDRLEQIVLRKQLIVALERAVNAATHHAEECIRINAKLLRHISMLNHFFSWVKQQVARVCSPASAGELHNSEVQRRQCVSKEATEFHRRLMWLMQVAETFVNLVGGCGGALGRHQRLAQVVHVAQIHCPDGLGAHMEDQCEGIADLWRQAARKLDAIVYSLHMRDEAFLDIIRYHRLNTNQTLAALASMVPPSLPWRNSCLRASDGESSVAKLSVLTAIAASKVDSASELVSPTCLEGPQK